MSGWHLGIIGGSGLYEPGALEDGQEIPVASPFGEPSGPVITGSIAGVRCTFIARHGAGHRIAPAQVNYRANIDVLKRCGVSDVLAIGAVGSLDEGIAPGDFVVVDQIIDRTLMRARSFFAEGIVAHVPLADPVCPRLSGLAARAASEAGARVHEGGTYIAIEGPQFSTRAESALYRQWGAQVIGMTAMPEARLAREAELPYALVGLVTDHDCWRAADANLAVADVLAVMRDNADRARTMIGLLAASLPPTREPSPIDTVLDRAIATPPAHWPEREVLRLGAVAGRVLQKSRGLVE